MCVKRFTQQYLTGWPSTMTNARGLLGAALLLVLSGCLSYNSEPFPIDDYTLQLNTEIAQLKAKNAALQQRINQLEAQQQEQQEQQKPAQ